MEMRRLVGARRNGVHVYVEKLRVVRLGNESRKAGFLGHLTLRRGAPRRIGVLDVTTGLQPQVKLAVMNQRCV